MTLVSQGGKSIPFIPLSAYYFFYFAAVGTLIPYVGLYFQSLSLGAVDIAQLLAVLSMARIVSPPLLALLADRRGQFLFYGQLTSFISALLVFGFWWFDDYASLLWLVWWLGFFWHAALPPMESLTLRTLGDNLAPYSRIRLWGSVGFIVAVMLVGWLINLFGQIAFLWSMTVFFMAMAVVTLINQDQPHTHSKGLNLSGLWSIVKQPSVLLVLALALLMQVSHGIYYAFYSIMLDHAGYTATEIGLFWTLGVIAEIGLFWYFARWIELLSFRGWLLVATGLAVVRWVMIAEFESLWWLLAVAQLLHAATFGVFHSAVVQWLHEAFASHQAQGQALYSSITYGIGGVLGSLVAGYAWTLGQGSLTFNMAAMASFAALLLVFWLPKRDNLVAP
jgi:PPP family 3-phenylpropionic acid transporter